MSEKHVIWSNQDLEVTDDWREGYAEHLESNNLALDPNDEDAIYAWMEQMNSEYLRDERVNLNIQLSQPILLIADIGRWNGRFSGYKEIESGNIRDCLTSETDYTTWFVDEAGDLRCDASHHDGTNHYLYRVYKDGVSDEQIEDLKEKIYEGRATQADIESVTRRLGDEIANVYGWDLSAPAVDMSPYMSQGFDRQQLAQIKSALKYGFTAQQMAVFARPEFSAPQMAQLIYGLHSGLPMEQYAKPELSAKELVEIRAQLAKEQQGSSIPSLAVQIAKGEALRREADSSGISAREVSHQL